jgi:hypothetical protein
LAAQAVLHDSAAAASILRMPLAAGWQWRMAPLRLTKAYGCSEVKEALSLAAGHNVICSLGGRPMIRSIMQEVAAGLALLLFVAMIALWAQFIAL